MSDKDPAAVINLLFDLGVAAYLAEASKAGAPISTITAAKAERFFSREGALLAVEAHNLLLPLQVRAEAGEQLATFFRKFLSGFVKTQKDGVIPVDARDKFQEMVTRMKEAIAAYDAQQKGVEEMK